MCVHRNAHGGWITCFANEFTMAFLTISSSSFLFSSTASPLLQIFYTLSLFIAAQEYILCKVRSSVFTKVKGEQNAFLCSLLTNFFVPGVWTFILHT